MYLKCFLIMNVFFFFYLCSSYCAINKNTRHCFAITCHKCPQKYSLTLWSCTLLYMVRTEAEEWPNSPSLVGVKQLKKRKKRRRSLSCDISRHQPQPMRVALQGSMWAPVLPFSWDWRTALVPCNIGDVGVSTYLAKVDWLLSHCSEETWKSSRKPLVFEPSNC